MAKYITALTTVLLLIFSAFSSFSQTAVFHLKGQIVDEINTALPSSTVVLIDQQNKELIFKDKGVLRLGVNDIYQGNRGNSIQSYSGFYLRSYSYYESRQVRLNFTYKFADSGVKGPRTRNSALGDENGRIK